MNDIEVGDVVDVDADEFAYTGVRVLELVPDVRLASGVLGDDAPPSRGFHGPGFLGRTDDGDLLFSFKQVVPGSTDSYHFGDSQLYNFNEARDAHPYDCTCAMCHHEKAETCGNCGSKVGHGCPDSEPCDNPACVAEREEEPLAEAKPSLHSRNKDYLKYKERQEKSDYFFELARELYERGEYERAERNERAGAAALKSAEMYMKNYQNALAKGLNEGKAYRFTFPHDRGAKKFVEWTKGMLSHTHNAASNVAVDASGCVVTVPAGGLVGLPFAVIDKEAEFYGAPKGEVIEDEDHAKLAEVIRKCGDKWCLFTKHKKNGKQRRLGTHDSKADAESQEKAIKAHGG